MRQVCLASTGGPATSGTSVDSGDKVAAIERGITPAPIRQAKPPPLSDTVDAHGPNGPRASNERTVGVRAGTT